MSQIDFLILSQFEFFSYCNNLVKKGFFGDFYLVNLNWIFFCERKKNRQEVGK